MNMKTIGYIALVAGVLALLVGALADVIGVGQDEGIGTQQTALMIAGVVVALVGGYLSFMWSPGASE